MSKNPFEILGLDPEVGPAAVRAKWRELASMHHPDKGGDPERFDKCNKAFHAALEISMRPKQCFHCNGTGKTEQRRGFHSITKRCIKCKGTGKQEVVG